MSISLHPVADDRAQAAERAKNAKNDSPKAIAYGRQAEIEKLADAMEQGCRAGRKLGPRPSKS